ncbi:MAG: hypothetical protein JXJ22_16175 [Bacteroidales bacterium]|nr:hypothetical protein [Bacteroidales bacterium]
MKSPLPLTRVLVCPLNWGLGHASRDIPIIQQLLAYNFNVFLGGNGPSLTLLRKEFPDLESIHIPSREIKYSSSSKFLNHFFSVLFPFVTNSIREHFYLRKIVRQKKIQLVISDNRIGLFNKNVYCIYITHQIFVILPGIYKFFEPLFHVLHKQIIRKFDECWIPDYKDNISNLSGKLAHLKKIPGNTRFVGILSRFSDIKISPEPIKNNILIILSGPEPQRSILEQILMDQCINTPLQVILLRGLPDNEKIIPPNKNIIFYNHLPVKQFYSLLLSSEIIVCRSGYTTIMDLIAVQKSAILIPTPGQTEQEYLGKWMDSGKGFITQSQHGFNLKEAIVQFRQQSNTEYKTYVPLVCKEIRKLKNRFA